MSKPPPQINLEYIFPTALYTIQLEGMGEINREFEKEMYVLKETNTTLGNSSQGGWHSPYLDTDKPYIKNITKKLFPPLNIISENMGIDTNNYGLYCESLWSIINTPHSYNTLHHHPNSILSCAYYIKSPLNSGNFKIKDPRLISGYSHPLNQKISIDHNKSSLISNSIEKSITPKEGTFIIFPSWLEHRVSQNLSNEDRIVVSFNITLRKKEQNEEW